MQLSTSSRLCKNAVRVMTAGAVLLSVAWPASGQNPQVVDIKAKAGKIPAAVRTRRGTLGVSESLQESVKFALRPPANVGLYIPLLASSVAVDAFKTDVDEARVDKQVGAGSSSSGSTSLTSKGSAPAILGFAVENGALEKSVSGTAITFKGRPVQIIQALQKTPFAQSLKAIEDNGSLGALNRFSFGFTFDTSRDNTSGTFTASANQLSSYTVHVDVLNWRDPRNKHHSAQWETLRLNTAQTMANRLYDAFDTVLESKEFLDRFNVWLEATSKAIADGINANKTDDELQPIIEDRLSKFPSASGIPGADAALKAFADASSEMFKARANILDYIGKAPIVSVDFVGDSAAAAKAGEVKLPDTSTLNVIAELAPFSGGSFTLNGSATIFNTVPLNITASRIRHVEVASQLDIPVNPSASQIGSVVLSFAFKYKHIPNDVLAVAGTATTQDAALKGDIVFGQAKLTFPVKGSGVKVPLSVTFANRSELIKETVVRANLGFTLDMDTIIGKLKP